jgi:polyphosphate kinase
MNSLSDFGMIDKLQTSNAGVKIQLEVRGICSLIPGVKGMSANIEAIDIIYNSNLHFRYGGGQTEVFISSADFMTRNLDGRVEVTCPIYDQEIKKELMLRFRLER